MNWRGVLGLSFVGYWVAALAPPWVLVDAFGLLFVVSLVMLGARWLAARHPLDRRHLRGPR